MMFRDSTTQKYVRVVKWVRTLSANPVTPARIWVMYQSTIVVSLSLTDDRLLTETRYWIGLISACFHQFPFHINYSYYL